MTSRLWPSPKDHPYPRPLQAQASSSKRFVVGSGFVLGGLLAGLIGMYVHRGPLMGVVPMALGAVAGFIQLFDAWRLHRKRASSQPVIEMNADGLNIPEWFDEKVPWSEVTHVDYRHPSLSIEIRDEDRFKPSNSRRIATLTHAVACPNSGPLPAGVPEGLDVSPKVLFEAIQAHRAHFGNGGRPASL
jgi:hypothetical protein